VLLEGVLPATRGYWCGGASVERLPTVIDVVQEAQPAFLGRPDHTRVVEVVVEALAVGNHPADQIHGLLRLFPGASCVLLVAVNQHPGEPGDRKAVRIGRIGEGGAHVRGQLYVRGGRYGIKVGFNEVAGPVLHECDAQAVGDSILMGDVADCSGSLGDEAGDAIVATAAVADGHGDARLRALAPYFGPSSRGLGEVVNENGGGSRRICAVYDRDVQIRQTEVRVEFLEAGIAPVRDAAQVYFREHFAGEAEG